MPYNSKTFAIFLLLFYIMSCQLFVFFSLYLYRPEVDTTPVVHIEKEKEKKIEGKSVVGIASWYDYDLNSKNQKCLDDNCWSLTHSTCASKTFKRHSTITVENLANGKKVQCFVNDYGPTKETKREIDLSSFAFKQLAPLGSGLINVKIYE